MFSDSQAKKIVGKKWRIILPATIFLQTKFYADFFSFHKVIYCTDLYSQLLELLKAILTKAPLNIQENFLQKNLHEKRHYLKLVRVLAL